MESIIQRGEFIDVHSLYGYFQTLADSRKRRGRRYSLALILVLILLAKICGENHPYGIAEWVKHRADLLVDRLKLDRQQMPHHSTYRRILADVIGLEELERLSAQYLSGKSAPRAQVLLAFDGKVLRGTLDADQQGTYLLAAYLPEEGLVLNEVAYAGKGHELSAAGKVLQGVDLHQKVVMGDALHTQKGVSSQIVEAGGEYIFLAKGNQSELETNIRLWFEPDGPPIPGMGSPKKDHERVSLTNKGHGRVETRTLTVSSQLKEYLTWPYLEQVFQLERRSISTKTGEVKQQVVFGLTSLSREEIPPMELLKKTRSYWGIESGLHYRRDVTLREDYTRMTQGHMGQAMACLNNLLLGILLPMQKFQTIPEARRYYSAHPEDALNLLLRL